MCKILCNVVQYINKTFVQFLFKYIIEQKVVQYFVNKSAILAMLSYKNIIAKYCIYSSILWTILEPLSL